MPTEDEYWHAIQSEICVRCDDREPGGQCTMTGNIPCPLRAYLPEILDVVNSIYSHSLAPYEELLRNRVCGLCANLSATGQCVLPSNKRCALDHFLPLVVQVIEDTQLGQRFHEP